MGKELEQIPEGLYQANRYNTDNKMVLHLWKDGESYDITGDFGLSSNAKTESEARGNSNLVANNSTKVVTPSEQSIEELERILLEYTFDSSFVNTMTEKERASVVRQKDFRQAQRALQALVDKVSRERLERLRTSIVHNADDLIDAMDLLEHHIKALSNSTKGERSE